MNYSDAIEFLYNALPMYQRTGAAAYKANLDNTKALDKYFSHPHRNFKTIHIAGTNGKGSVSHMLASIMQSAGYKTGLYTSPHLLDFRERIRVNGRPVSEDFVSSFVTEHQEIIKKLEPSFFEMTVAMAFEYFDREKVDIAIVETGMGGRLDSTNIITPLLSIITNISLDHMHFLGDTPALIAKEKAGIIKPGIPVVIGESDHQTDPVFVTAATKSGSEFSFASGCFQLLFSTLNFDGKRVWRYKNASGEYIQVISDLTGDYQEMNIKTVLCSLEKIKKNGFSISLEAIQEGLANTCSVTGLRGRWETLGANPRIICDTGHNEAGIRQVLKQINQLPWKKLHMIWGMVNDKDITGILSFLPKNAVWYFARASVPRSLEADLLKEKAMNAGLSGMAYRSVQEAVSEARKAAGPDDLIFIGGSTFIVADALALFPSPETKY